MLSLPKSNKGAAIGAMLTAALVALANWGLQFLASGDPFPTSWEGWARLIGPPILAGLLGLKTPHYSQTEARAGVRTVTPPPAGSDAPVINKTSS